MADPIDALDGERFLAFDVELEPVGSPTFQVTTFANTGPSFYRDREGRLSAVVDSVASVANQLEATVWDDAAQAPVDAIAALSWVRVVDDAGERYTSSRTAAHRLNADALMRGVYAATGVTMGAEIRDALGTPAPPIAHRLADVAWARDPLAILHGLWWAGEWGGRARMPRALTGRIDAHGVESQAVQVGGQKTADHLREVGARQARDGGATVAGEVPAYLSEVSAQQVTARFLLDLRLLRSYGLGDARTRALTAVALLQLGEMIDAWPRRRSRCALDVIDFDEARRAKRTRRPFTLPEVDELRTLARAACEAVGDGGVREVVFTPPKPKAKKAADDE